MDEYANRFLELSIYTPGLVMSEQQKIDRFIYGLPTGMHNIMVGQVFPSLTEVIDRARRIELRLRERWTAEIEAQRKRPRIESAPSGSRTIQPPQAPIIRQPQAMRTGLGQ